MDRSERAGGVGGDAAATPQLKAASAPLANRCRRPWGRPRSGDPRGPWVPPENTHREPVERGGQVGQLVGGSGLSQGRNGGKQAGHLHREERERGDMRGCGRGGGERVVWGWMGGDWGWSGPGAGVGSGPGARASCDGWPRRWRAAPQPHSGWPQLRGPHAQRLHTCFSLGVSGTRGLTWLVRVAICFFSALIWFCSWALVGAAAVALPAQASRATSATKVPAGLRGWWARRVERRPVWVGKGSSAGLQRGGKTHVHMLRLANWQELHCPHHCPRHAQFGMLSNFALVRRVLGKAGARLAGGWQLAVAPHLILAGNGLRLQTGGLPTKTTVLQAQGGGQCKPW